MRNLVCLVAILLVAACGGRSRGNSSPEVTRAATPIATSTTNASQTVTESVADSDYRQAIITEGRELTEGIQSIGSLMQNPQLTNDAWLMQMGAAIVRIQIAEEEIAKLTPPSVLTEFHTAMVGAAGTCSNFATTLSSAIDNQNTDTLATAMTLLEACKNELKQASSLLP